MPGNSNDNPQIQATVLFYPDAPFGHVSVVIKDLNPSKTDRFLVSAIFEKVSSRSHVVNFQKEQEIGFFGRAVEIELPPMNGNYEEIYKKAEEVREKFSKYNLLYRNCANLTLATLNVAGYTTLNDNLKILSPLELAENLDNFDFSYQLGSIKALVKSIKTQTILAFPSDSNNSQLPPEIENLKECILDVTLQIKNIEEQLGKQGTSNLENILPMVEKLKTHIDNLIKEHAKNLSDFTPKADRTIRYLANLSFALLGIISLGLTYVVRYKTKGHLGYESSAPLAKARKMNHLADRLKSSVKKEQKKQAKRKKHPSIPFSQRIKAFFKHLSINRKHIMVGGTLNIISHISMAFSSVIAPNNFALGATLFGGGALAAFVHASHASAKKGHAQKSTELPKPEYSTPEHPISNSQSSLFSHHGQHPSHLSKTPSTTSQEPHANNGNAD